MSATGPKPPAGPSSPKPPPGPPTPSKALDERIFTAVDEVRADLAPLPGLSRATLAAVNLQLAYALALVGDLDPFLWFRLHAARCRVDELLKLPAREDQESRARALGVATPRGSGQAIPAHDFCLPPRLGPDGVQEGWPPTPPPPPPHPQPKLRRPAVPLGEGVLYDALPGRAS